MDPAPSATAAAAAAAAVPAAAAAVPAAAAVVPAAAPAAAGEAAATSAPPSAPPLASDDAASLLSAPSANPCTSGRPECYVLVATQTKKLNIGMTVRSAVAFGAAELLVAGSRAVRTHGDMGTLRHTRVREFDKLRHAVAWLRGRGVTVCGIEITPDAVPVERHPFRGPTAFLAGAEGDGLRPAHKALCDHFVYIPQYGTGTASLNVTVATSIVLHHFATWAAYAEAPREAGCDKFTVAAPPKKAGAEGDIDVARREARARARVEAAADGDGGGLLGALALADGDDEEGEAEDADEGHGEEDEDGLGGGAAAAVDATAVR
jgi:tRNA G18 (ribose-2'-O)-methylase SpoU